MLALNRKIRYSSHQAKVTKTNKLQKIQKNFLLVVANAIRYPPQHKVTRFMRVSLCLNGATLFCFY